MTSYQRDPGYPMTIQAPGISIDRSSADYCRLARWRTTDRGEQARVLGPPKPPPVPQGQDALFDVPEAS